ncbi:MAG: hypothetical protein JW981_10715 [Anaerolineae bacterium]|nr:hypothetical protein [Anaerolineae bacterium]
MPKLTKNVLSSIFPSTKALIWFWIAIGILFFGLVCSLAMAFTPSANASNSPPVVLAGFVFGFLTLPVTALGLQIAAIAEKRPVPKLVLGVLSVMALIISAIILMLSMRADNESSWPMMGLFIAPFIVLFSIVPIYALTRAPQEFRAISLADQEERAIALIKSQGGEVTYEELATELGISEDKVDALLLQLVRSKRLIGAREIPFRRFYTIFALEEKRLQILGRVKARGEIPMRELAAELNAPHGLVKEWVYRLVQNGRFTGYINWDEDILYSAEAQHLREAGRCPNCGGELGMAGKGIVRCGRCGTEIFL